MDSDKLIQLDSDTVDIQTQMKCTLPDKKETCVTKNKPKQVCTDAPTV